VPGLRWYIHRRYQSGRPTKWALLAKVAPHHGARAQCDELFSPGSRNYLLYLISYRDQAAFAFAFGKGALRLVGQPTAAAAAAPHRLPACCGLGLSAPSAFGCVLALLLAPSLPRCLVFTWRIPSWAGHLAVLWAWWLRRAQPPLWR
jgi:hypothetical protein